MGLRNRTQQPFWRITPIRSTDPSALYQHGIECVGKRDGKGMIATGWALCQVTGLHQYQASDFLTDGYRLWRESAGFDRGQAATFLADLFGALCSLTPPTVPADIWSASPESVMPASIYYGTRCWTGNELLEVATDKETKAQYEPLVFRSAAEAPHDFVPTRSIEFAKAYAAKNGLPEPWVIVLPGQREVVPAGASSGGRADGASPSELTNYAPPPSGPASLSNYAPPDISPPTLANYTAPPSGPQHLSDYPPPQPPGPLQDEPPGPAMPPPGDDQAEQERAEQERAEQERAERERQEREQAEREERERAARAEQERQERERQEQERLRAEQQRRAREQQERQTAQSATVEQAKPRPRPTPGPTRMSPRPAPTPQATPPAEHRDNAAAVPPRLADLRSKLLSWLNTSYRDVRLESNGWITIPDIGPSVIQIETSIIQGGHMKAEVFAPLVLDVPLSDDLFRYVGLEGGRFHFGVITLDAGEDGSDELALLQFSHSLLADNLQRDELLAVVWLVAATVTSRAPELHRRFGGMLFAEIAH